MPAIYPVPLEDAFKDDFGAKQDFLRAPDLRAIADELIERHARFEFLNQLRIHYLYKAKGGVSADKAVFGKSVKPSGLMGWYADADFVIWLAADNMRNSFYTREQVERLVMHEMCHIALDPETGEPRLVAHDFEDFSFVVGTYGFAPEMEAVRQIALFEREKAVV